MSHQRWMRGDIKQRKPAVGPGGYDRGPTTSRIQMAWFASPLAMTGGPPSLFIDDAVRTSLNNLGLEHRLNDQFAAGHEAMRLSRKQFWGRCE